MYITVTKANDLLSGQPDIGEWAALGIAQKNSLLERASRRIEMIDFSNDDLPYPQGYVDRPRYVNNFKQLPMGVTEQAEIELPIALACARLAIHYMRNPLADFINTRSGQAARDSAFMDDLPIDVQSALWSFTSQDQRDAEEDTQAEQDKPRRTAASITYGDEDVRSEIESPLGTVGDTTSVPTSGSVDRSQVEQIIDDQVADWAEEGNTDQIPANKLQNAPGGSGGSGADTVARNAATRAQDTADGNTLNIETNRSNIERNASRLATAESDIAALEAAPDQTIEFEVQDEGTKVGADAQVLDFVGTGVTVTGAGAKKTVTIEGGGGSGGGQTATFQVEELFSKDNVALRTGIVAVGNFNITGAVDELFELIVVGTLTYTHSSGDADTQLALSLVDNIRTIETRLSEPEYNNEHGEFLSLPRVQMNARAGAQNVERGAFFTQFLVHDTTEKTIYIKYAPEFDPRETLTNVKVYKVLSSGAGNSSGGKDQTARDGVTANKALIDRNKSDIGALDTAVQGINREITGANAAITALETQDMGLLNRVKAIEAASSVGGKLEITPNNIAAAADLDGTYQGVLSGMDADALHTLGVNELEIWVGTEAIQSFDPWATQDTFRFNFTVDTTEETQIGLTNQNVIRVLAVFRNSGTFVGQIATALTIGGANVNLTKRQQVELMGITLGPDTVTEHSIQGTYEIRYETPPFNMWAAMSIAGQPLPRQALHGATKRNYTISQALADTLSNNNQSAKSLDVELLVYDAATAGNLIATIRRTLDITRVATGSIGLAALKDVRVASEAAYRAIANKDLDTIYWWPL